MTAMTQPQPQLSDLFQLGRYHELIEKARAQAVTPETDPLAAQLLAASLFRILLFCCPVFAAEARFIPDLSSRQYPRDVTSPL